MDDAGLANHMSANMILIPRDPAGEMPVPLLVIPPCSRSNHATGHCTVRIIHQNRACTGNDYA